MNDLGELDRPETPTSPGPWDARSEETLSPETDASSVPEAAADGDRLANTEATTGGEPLAKPEGATGSSKPSVRDTATGSKPPAREAGTGRKASAHETGSDRKAAAPRRGAADPVKALMHRHRDLCERAVDPLEIAAGLEAHGITDRTAARFRHRDVFSLAEEMYARASRDGDAPPPTPPTAPRVRADWVLLTLLPGALCAAAVSAVRLTDGQTR
ncbi:hypothetical protein ABZZ16_36630, partial [Streptomyces sp. NPDC006386]